MITLAVSLVGIRISFGSGNGGFVLLACGSISIPSETSLLILVGLLIVWRAIEAHQKKLSSKARREARIDGNRLSESLCGAKGFGARVLFQDGMKGFIWELVNLYHVDHQSELVGAVVHKQRVGDDLFSEKAPHSFLGNVNRIDEAEGLNHQCAFL